ncbi:MAG: monofunctional biosynthetic peptidoglycan transglycosylase [Tenuifilaceae bacterium]
MPSKIHIHKSLKDYTTKSLIYKGLMIFILAFIFSSVSGVLIYRWANQNITMLMVIRHYESLFGGKSSKIQKDWVSIDEISKNMILATIAAEDSKFITHWGFDFEHIKQAFKHNQQSKRIKGASTISQQTAKNIFLWPKRSWIRKGFEAYFTVLMEGLWTKKRIMEVYLNIVEFGKGVYGVEKAAQKFYKKPAKQLNRYDAAMLTTVLPSPAKRNPANPSSYMYSYQRRVLWNMTTIGSVDLNPTKTIKNKKSK